MRWVWHVACLGKQYFDWLPEEKRSRYNWKDNNKMRLRETNCNLDFTSSEAGLMVNFSYDGL